MRKFDGFAGEQAQLYAKVAESEIWRCDMSLIHEDALLGARHSSSFAQITATGAAHTNSCWIN